MEQTTARDDEIVAIQQTVAEAEKYQSEVAPFVALHTADAIIVNIAGRRVLGREAIRQAMAAALETPMAKVFTKSEIVDIRFVGPDVAIVSCVKHVSDERDPSATGGADADPPATGNLTYVMANEDGTWRIALAQTTPIQ